MEKKYLLALDQGTTSSRSIVFTLDGHMVASAAQEFPQHYPQPGWVEHDPGDILRTQIESMREAVQRAGIDPREIAAAGIANQRETTLLWDRKTGECVYNAIVWQCRRTAPQVDRLVKDGFTDTIRNKTGLVPDAYFSGTKLSWLLDEAGMRARAEEGELCFGTVDSFLAWHLIKGHPHVTDATNASRTLLYNIKSQDWDDDLLRILRIPRAVLPRVLDTAEVIGEMDEHYLGAAIPVAAMAGDQQAALFGQACIRAGMAKNTYGTGCFLLMNAGSEFKLSKSGLVTTVAWRLKGRTTYALEGSVFMGGAAVQWLRDEMQFISSAAQSEEVAQSVPDTGNVYLVPAFTGLGAPHWNMRARGTLTGMTRGTGRAQIVRAALEAIAYQSRDLLTAMAKDACCETEILRADGGAAANNFLMQFQSDITGIEIARPKVLETTALGAALLAGLAVGVYGSIEDTARGWHRNRIFTPSMAEEKRAALLKGWERAVRTVLEYAKISD